MDKLILVYYVNIGTFNQSEVSQFMERFVKSVENKDMIQYYVPVRGENSRIECINPKLINEDEFKKVKETLDSYKSKLDEFLNTTLNYEFTK